MEDKVEYKMSKKQSNKTYMFVKLTDSCIKSLLGYLDDKNPSNKLFINFNKNEGQISIPTRDDDDDEVTYSFVINNNPGNNLIMNENKLCNSMSQLGSLSKMLRVKPKEDIFETTKNRMVAIEEKRKQRCVKEVELTNSKNIGKTVIKRYVVNNNQRIINKPKSMNSTKIEIPKKCENTTISHEIAKGSVNGLNRLAAVINPTNNLNRTAIGQLMKNISTNSADSKNKPSYGFKKSESINRILNRFNSPKTIESKENSTLEEIENIDSPTNGKNLSTGLPDQKILVKFENKPNSIKNETCESHSISVNQDSQNTNEEVLEKSGVEKGTSPNISLNASQLSVRQKVFKTTGRNTPKWLSYITTEVPRANSPKKGKINLDTLTSNVIEPPRGKNAVLPSFNKIFIQVLAIKPRTRIELSEAVKKYRKTGSKNKWLKFLKEVAYFSNNIYTLQGRFWNDVDENWSLYNVAEKKIVKMRKMWYMESANKLESIPKIEKNGEIEECYVSKKQRISHFAALDNKKEQNNGLPSLGDEDIEIDSNTKIEEGEGEYDYVKNKSESENEKIVNLDDEPKFKNFEKTLLKKELKNSAESLLENLGLTMNGKGNKNLNKMKNLKTAPKSKAKTAYSKNAIKIQNNIKIKSNKKIDEYIEDDYESKDIVENTSLPELENFENEKIETKCFSSNGITKNGTIAKKRKISNEGQNQWIEEKRVKKIDVENGHKEPEAYVNGLYKSRLRERDENGQSVISPKKTAINDTTIKSDVDYATNTPSSFEPQIIKPNFNGFHSEILERPEVEPPVRKVNVTGPFCIRLRSTEINASLSDTRGISSSYHSNVHYLNEPFNGFEKSEIDQTSDKGKIDHEKLITPTEHKIGAQKSIGTQTTSKFVNKYVQTDAFEPTNSYSTQTVPETNRKNVIKRKLKSRQYKKKLRLFRERVRENFNNDVDDEDESELTIEKILIDVLGENDEKFGEKLQIPLENVTKKMVEKYIKMYNTIVPRYLYLAQICGNDQRLVRRSNLLNELSGLKNKESNDYLKLSMELMKTELDLKNDEKFTNIKKEMEKLSGVLYNLKNVIRNFKGKICTRH